ncbi:MAG: hypothetical protein HYX43_00410 [Burkholderiales bacterium]|nr:hypothetical protein [Burkholderiales bacterium]
MNFHDFRLLEARLDETEQRLAALEAAIGVGNLDVTGARHATRKAERRARIAEVAVLCGLPVMMLFVTHYFLMIFFGELNPRHMLIAAVAMPLPFGFLIASGGLRRLTLWLLGSVVLALVATLGMNVVSALMHGDSIFPQTTHEIWEFITYAVSIGLSHAAGLILGLTFWQFVTRVEVSRNRARWQYRLARFLVGRHYDAQQGHRAAVTLLRIARMLVALAAIAGSVYSGWLRFRA